MLNWGQGQGYKHPLMSSDPFQAPNHLACRHLGPTLLQSPSPWLPNPPLPSPVC